MMDVQMFQRHRAALFPLGKHLVHLFFALDPDKGMTNVFYYGYKLHAL